MKAIILSRFDPVYGSKIFLKTSDTLNEEELLHIPQLMTIPSKGFFIHVFENLRTANLFLKLPSKFARGRFEKLLISIITDINNDLNLSLSRELLENFATSLLNLKDAYKAFDIEMKNYKGDPEKLSEIEKLLSSFYITIKPAIKALEISELNLKERVKELICIYGISKLSEDPNITINDLLQQVTLEMIPSAYQFPEITCVRIIYDNKEYRTENFTDTQWTQIVTKEISEKILTIQVNYIEDKSFLKEEKDLSNEIGNKLKKIIEQIEAEQKLKDTHSELNQIFNAALPMCVIDKNYNHIQVNDRFNFFYNLKVDEAYGKKCHEIREGLRCFTPECTVKQFFEGKEHIDYEIENELSNGTKVFYIISAFPYLNTEGEIIGVIETFTDITERKKAEEDLRTSEVKYRTLSKNIPGMVYRAKPDWSTEIITNCDDICGYSIEEFDSLEINWFEIIHPDDKNKILNDSATMLKNSITLIQEYRIITKDGSTRWVEDYKTSFFNKDGSFKGIDGVVYDITERKKAEHIIEERIKELNCLYSISKIVEEEFIEINELLSQSVEFLPPAWQFPEVTCARIVVDGQEYKTDNFKETKWKQASDIIIDKEKIGTVEIYYLEEMPEFDEGPFLKEERDLIDAITVKLGNNIKRFEVEHAIGERIKELSCLYGVSNIIEKKDLEIEELLSQSVEFLPPAWQFPDVVCARIVVDNQEYKTNNFKETKWKQASDIIIEKEKIGTVEIYYLEEMPEFDEGSFLKEERHLIDNIAAVLGIYLERKKKEEEIRLQSEIIENMSEGVYLIKLDDGTIVYTNPAFEEMFGYNPGEMIGKDVAIVNAPIDKKPEETKDEIMGILKETGEWHGEVLNIKKDGTPFWCYANVSLFDHPKYGRVIISVHTDITERKKAEQKLKDSEEKFRIIAASANDAMGGSLE